MNLTCANCGSKLDYSAGKLNFAVEPCEECCVKRIEVETVEYFYPEEEKPEPKDWRNRND